MRCTVLAALVQLLLWRQQDGNPDRFSPIFWYLLRAFDTHGNVLLFAAVVLAFALRRSDEALGVVRFAARRPWLLAAAAFALLCAGARFAYHAHPLSMDEYSALFQAEAFATGRLAGELPVAWLDRLIPPFFQSYFFRVDGSSGAVSSAYWPGFALLLAPFAWLGVPWVANPLLGALAIPAVHRLASAAGGATDASTEAGGWAVLLLLASPVFVISSISFYSLPAHLLLNATFAVLLLKPTPSRAALAGLVGSLALTLHNPVPHALFSLAFLAWLAARRSFGALAALLAGYVPLCALLGLGWHFYLLDLVRPLAEPGAGAAGQAAASSSTTALGAAASAVVQAIDGAIRGALPSFTMEFVQARLAGLSKLWTWSTAGLVVLAAYGLRSRHRPGVEAKLLAAAFAVTIVGYFFVRFDQGHGWGYRYAYPAFFALPVLAAVALCRPGEDEARLPAMAAWAALLSIPLAVGLRLVQVESFVDRHLGQVPPLATPASEARREVVFVNFRTGFYSQDLVQNDPFLRSPRIIMVHDEGTETFMKQHFPRYEKAAEGPWGEQWIEARPTKQR